MTFDSDNNTLVPEDHPVRILDLEGNRDIFVLDRQSKRIVRVNVGPHREQANAQSNDPSISADGMTVAFQSAASNLIGAPSPAWFWANLFIVDWAGSEKDAAAPAVEPWTFEPAMSSQSSKMDRGR